MDWNSDRLHLSCDRSSITIDIDEIPKRAIEVDTEKWTQEGLKEWYFGGGQATASIKSTLCCGQKILSGHQDWEHRFWANLYHTFAWIWRVYSYGSAFGSLVYTSICVCSEDYDTSYDERECHCEECDYCWDYEYEPDGDIELWDYARDYMREDCEGMMLKGIIERSGFGEVDVSEPWFNPNSNNWVRTFTWRVDREGLRAYGDRVLYYDEWKRPKEAA